MSAVERRRPLEDLLDELVAGLQWPARPEAPRSLRLSDVELALPVEMRVRPGPRGPVVHADMPSLRTRTGFDLPVGRLVLRLQASRPGDAA